jgi:nitrosocyanin
MMNRNCFFRIAFVLLFLSTPAWADDHEDAPEEEMMTKAEFVTAMDGEKKIWSPASAQFKKGEAVKLILKNELKADHGFTIEELDVAEVVPAGKTKEIVVDLIDAGELKFYCQLHPAHVGGVLKVE